MTAQDRLTAALAVAADLGRQVPCTSAGVGWWLSEDPDERLQAAARCMGCPVFSACAAAAQEAGEEFGVWAGVDRTRRVSSRRVSRTGSRVNGQLLNQPLASGDTPPRRVTARPLSLVGAR